MPTHHEAVTALPVGSAASKEALRALIIKRMPMSLAAADDLQNITVVDPDAATIPLFVAQLGRLFELDAADATTAHDGTTCLVSAEGKRYKVVSFEYPFSVLDKDLTEPPAAPAVGDAYIVGVAATNDWSGKDNQVGVYTERGWNFVTIPIGKLVYVEDETGFYHRNGAGAWTPGIGSLTLGSGVVMPSNIKGGGAKFVWPVENQTTNAPPGDVAEGASYIIGSSPTGAWSGHSGKIAHGENGTWVIYQPANGWFAYDKSLNNYYRFTGSAWVSSQGAWTGLSVGASEVGNTSAIGTTQTSFAEEVNHTTSIARRQDNATITHTAKAATAKLKITYSVWATNVFNMWGALLFRDSEENAIAFSILGDGGELNQHATAVFLVAVPDTNAHIYTMCIAHYQNAAPPLIAKRTFIIEEAAVI